MFKRYPKYTHGQELATKFWWSITQLAATAVHDTFILVYSSLPETENGNVSINDYLAKAKKLHVLHELHEAGFDIANLKVSPKKAVSYDLQVTRKILDHVKAKPQHKGHLITIKHMVKELVCLRNVLCHHKMRSTTVPQLIEDLDEVKDILWELYSQAAEMSGVREADIAEAYLLLQRELDSLVSPTYDPHIVCSRCSKELKTKGNEERGEHGEKKENLQNQQYGKIRENGNIQDFETIGENESEENDEVIENGEIKKHGIRIRVERESNDLDDVNNIKANDGSEKTSIHIQRLMVAQNREKGYASDKYSSSEEEEAPSSSEVSSSSSSTEDSESDSSLQNKEDLAVEMHLCNGSYSSDNSEARDNYSEKEVKASTSGDDSGSEPSQQTESDTSGISSTKTDQGDENCSVSDAISGIEADYEGETQVTQDGNNRHDEYSNNEEEFPSQEISCSNRFNEDSEPDTSQRIKTDTLGTSTVKTSGENDSCSSGSGETRDESSSSGAEVLSLPQVRDSNISLEDSETESSRENKMAAPDTPCIEIEGSNERCNRDEENHQGTTNLNIVASMSEFTTRPSTKIIRSGGDPDWISTEHLNPKEYTDEKIPSQEYLDLPIPTKYLSIASLISRIVLFSVLVLSEVMAAVFVLVYVAFQLSFLLLAAMAVVLLKGFVRHAILSLRSSVLFLNPFPFVRGIPSL
ncbi:uncharacterized protein LOC122267003 [Penaeus japonicus]|uniref:uncharacterized protein LOC122267003 n=1 Tax=Penaeus japonicus TaxID=27405 RepID=UPI001C70E198|nr:uncharacterized protein LOC122267003 [Penaeus japonicus]XP_042893003.1 uncharacterized protein LOC122267003 [Penaeus japonicus]XP_042893073.1 uncharacterized protein LOC122267003 [Penaeus japonicus]